MSLERATKKPSKLGEMLLLAGICNECEGKLFLCVALQGMHYNGQFEVLHCPLQSS